MEIIETALGKRKADLVLKHGRILNVFTQEWTDGDVAICGEKIAGVGRYSGEKEIDCRGGFIVPGLIDAHIHMESSMVMPSELAKVLVKAGTTTIIADPHELVNVCGRRGMDFFLDATESLPITVFLMMPSSVPSADGETNGAGEILAPEMEPYVNHPRVLGLGEIMRYGDVLRSDKRMLDKISLFRDKHLDGHAPGITGASVQAYRAAGIENDHECTSAEEALEKLRAGFFIFLRYGSGAKNLPVLLRGFMDAGVPLTNCAFCTDDKHLEDIEREGHINTCVRLAISMGVSAAQAYTMGSLQAARHYGLKNKGAVAAGYDADILIIDDLKQASPKTVISKGKVIDDEYLSGFSYDIKDESVLNTVRLKKISPSQLRLPVSGRTDVIQIIPNELATRRLYERVPEADGIFSEDSVYNKLCVAERHGKNHKIGIAPVKGYGIRGGAIATTVAHDSHNIIAAGDNDSDLALAINELADMQGGYVIASGGTIVNSLRLPVGGLMSMEPSSEVIDKIREMVSQARAMGVGEGVDPFITLSFMALTAIPEIRLTERGVQLIPPGI